MKKWTKTENEIITEYRKILCKEEPEFLEEYIHTKPMQRLDTIGCACGTDYVKMFHNKFFYSNLQHSINVALIIWNFTKDKKQTLAGLFHDISTPVFKHCIDYMNGDYEKQESTEELTTKMIQESEEIMKLLKRDGILVEEVDDYHQYPIADNDTPKLSSDRLEYTLANGLYFKEVWSMEEIKEIYENIEVQKNEENVEELGFRNSQIAEKFIQGASELWSMWISNEDKITMQFYADMMKKMHEKRLITIEDLYTLSEKEVIHKMENCEDYQIAKAFRKFSNLTSIYESDEKPVEENYCISIPSKKRYIIPLVQAENESKRINEMSEIAKQKVEDYLSYRTKKYAYLDFNI